MTKQVASRVVQHVRSKTEPRTRTRTRTTSVQVVCGVSGTTSIDLTVGLDSPPDAWMEPGDLDLLDESRLHARCTYCQPVVGLLDVYVALCGKRALNRAEDRPNKVKPKSACEACAALWYTPCSRCGRL